MTIPRIGDKIIRVRKDIGDIAEVQNEQPENFLEDNNSTADNLETDDSINANNSEQYDSNEYSIEKFTADYELKLHKDVLPLLEQYEPERKQRLFLAMFIGIICSVIGLYFFFFTELDGKITGLFFSLAGLAWFVIKKSFEKKVKRKIMPILMKAVPDFYWQSETPIPIEDIKESNIFPYDKNTTKKFDDCFLGKYRDVNINIAECSYTMSKQTVFSGAVIRIKMNKNFDGLTVIRPKKDVDVKYIKDLKDMKLKKVELEDVEFNKKYNVYSTDQVEARYLLTTSFIERFQNINLAFNSKVAFCSFQGKDVFIAPYCKKDLFSICSLIKKVNDEEQFLKLFNEFTSILALVDHFKLDKKLGL